MVSAALLAAIALLAVCTAGRALPVSSGSVVPSALQVDWKATPSVGVLASPLFAWSVPHLRRGDGCGSAAAGADEPDQLQHSYQLQLVSAAGTPAEALLHDSGRTLSDASSSVVLGAAPALTAGTSYGWRVRVWTSADKAEGCASGWGSGRFTTALFDGALVLLFQRGRGVCCNSCCVFLLTPCGV